jgi:hypothetical protein
MHVIKLSLLASLAAGGAPNIVEDGAVLWGVLYSTVQCGFEFDHVQSPKQKYSSIFVLRAK